MQPETGAADRGSRQHPRELLFPGRRSFFAVLIGIGAALVGAVFAVPLIRFALYPLFAKTTETRWSDLGPLDSFASLTAPVQKVISVSQRDGWRESVSKRTVYVVKGPAGQLAVLSSVCPHLGCEVPWVPAKHEFFCPCHGSAFASDGARLSGPAPRGMDSLPTKVRDNHLMVRYEYFRQLLSSKEVVA